MKQVSYFSEVGEVKYDYPDVVAYDFQLHIPNREDQPSVSGTIHTYAGGTPRWRGVTEFNVGQMPDARRAQKLITSILAAMDEPDRWMRMYVNNTKGYPTFGTYPGRTGDTTTVGITTSITDRQNNNLAGGPIVVNRLMDELEPGCWFQDDNYRNYMILGMSVTGTNPVADRNNVTITYVPSIVIPGNNIRPANSFDVMKDVEAEAFAGRYASEELPSFAFPWVEYVEKRT